MEIKGLNQKQKIKKSKPENSEILNTVKLICPILLDDATLLNRIYEFVFTAKINEEDLLSQIIEKYDYLSLEDLENLIITLDGYKIIRVENNFNTEDELNKYFEYQKKQILIKTSKKNVIVQYRNEFEV